MVSAASTTNATRLSLEEVLQVLLVCFHAAADTAPKAIPAYALEFHDPSVPVPIWKIWSIEDLKFTPPDPEDLGRCSFLPPWLNDALSRFNMCDWFSLVLEAEVNRLVRELFNGRAQWLTYWPKIDRILTWRSNPNQPMVLMHSVLYVETGDGRQMIMDGTLRQYLWESSTWLQTCQEWYVGRVDWRRGWFFPSQKIRCLAEYEAARAAGGYWAFAFATLTQLFGDLDWEELRGLGPVERLERVKRMAEGKLAGFHGWAPKFG